MLSHSKEAVLAARDKAKHSALNIAAWHGNVEGVKLLIAAGADANNADVNGHRPLHHALHAQQPKPEIVQALLDAGRRLAGCNGKGQRDRTRQGEVQGPHGDREHPEASS